VQSVFVFEGVEKKLERNGEMRALSASYTHTNNSGSILISLHLRDGEPL